MKIGHPNQNMTLVFTIFKIIVMLDKYGLHQDVTTTTKTERH